MTHKMVSQLSIDLEEDRELLVKKYRRDDGQAGTYYLLELIYPAEDSDPEYSDIVHLFRLDSLSAKHLKDFL